MTLEELLDEYFEIGVREGAEGRNHDDIAGSAQKTRDKIRAVFQRSGEKFPAALSPLPAPVDAERHERAIEQARCEREYVAFQKWWKESGHADDPIFTLTMENCAHASWQERAHLSAMSAGTVAQEAVAWRCRHKNDGPHMWEYYPSSEEKPASVYLAIQDLTVRQMLDVLNDDKHAGAQERPPEPHSPNVSVPIELLQRIWSEMYHGVGGENGIDDAIAQWNIDEVVNILAAVDALPDTDSPSVRSALASPQAPVQEPVGYIRASLLDLLKSGHSGAYNAQVSNAAFANFTVPIFASPQASEPAPQVVGEQRDRLMGNLLDRWEMTPNDLKAEMREYGCGKQLDALASSQEKKG